MPTKPSPSPLPPCPPSPPARPRGGHNHTMARKGYPLLILLLFTTLNVTFSGDADALISFKSTVGGAATALRSWTGSAPCSGNHSNWAGVLCLNGAVYGLQLENMNLAGTLTFDALVDLPSLRTVSFMYSGLDGPMPDVGKLPALKAVFLSGNNLSGQIPDGIFAGMKKLKKVYLSQNNFSGPVPSSLTALPRLLELRLDENEFDGGLPDLRQPELKVVNVSFNNLQGPIPPGLSRISAAMFEGNQNLCGPPLAVKCEPTTTKKKFPLKIVLIVIAVLLIVAAVLILLFYRRQQSQLDRHSSSKTNKIEPSEAEKLEQGSSDYSIAAAASAKKGAKDTDQGRLVFVQQGRERFELHDLLRASAEVLGSGNFGSSYKAILLQGPSVVVKRFKEMNGVGREDFQEHMRRLGRLNHPNLLSLVAYYYRREEKLLVTDYVSNGSLAHMLHGNRGTTLLPLDWPTRLKIVKGVARGLSYLYDELPMLTLPHGHLKSSNVLLTDSYEPLLTDYALIPVMNAHHASQIMLAYKSPEVTTTGKISKKSDVWSFGILVLEILTGKFPATYLQRGKGSTDLGGWVNSVVKEEWTGEVFDEGMNGDEGEMVKLLHIGLGCCEVDVEKRWEMSEVLGKVEELNEVVERDSFVSEVSLADNN